MLHFVALPLLIAVTVAILLLTMVLTWSRREGTGGFWFLAALVCASWWLVGFGINMFVADIGASQWINTITMVGSALVPLAVLGFTLAYTGRHNWLSTPAFSGLVVVPAASVGILFAEQFYGYGLYRENLNLFFIGEFAFLSFDYGPWGNLQLAYAYMLLAVSIALLIELSFDERPLYRAQGVVLITAIFAPLLTNTLVIAEIGVLAIIDITPVSFLFTGLAIIVGMFRYQLLESVPVPTRVAHHGTLESLDSPVIVLDSVNEIIHTNPAASAMVQLGDRGLYGSPASSLPGVRSGSTDEIQTEPVVTVTNGNGRRIYSIRSTPLSDDQGHHYGTILLYQDITEHRQREQRLNVLNRVLRHDIRTEMNVIMGQARRGIDDSSGAHAAFSAIDETARSIVRTSETARNIERLVEIAPRLEPAGSLDRVLGDLEARFVRNHPEANLSINATADRSAIVPLGFEPVVWHLLDNAARHNPAADGSVQLDIAPADTGWIYTVVSDDGPGIPSDELRVFERGESSPLEHASGLGLWLVHWVVNEFGGEVTVTSTETGTEIAAVLPLVEQLEPTD